MPNQNMQSDSPIKNIPRVMNAWVVYDWANSVYMLVISSTIFPVFYNSVTREAFHGDKVMFLGIEIENTVLYSYSISFSFLLTACLAPLLSGMADYSGRKKLMLKLFTYLGAASCIALNWFDGSNVELGIFASIFACVGYAGGALFYNSFLPEIATADKFDMLSARGYSWGYIGGVVLQVINLVMLEYPSAFGLETEAQAAQMSFLTVGVWWALFAQIPFRHLPKDDPSPIDIKVLVAKGAKRLVDVWHSLKGLPTMRRFLQSFFLYNTAVQTVMLLAATFGEKQLHLPANSLIMAVLAIQFIAIPGAYFFAWVSKKHGNIYSISVMLVIWIAAFAGAYLVTTSIQFYVLAVVVGLVMGGIKSLSRSTYSKLIPSNTHDTASYFSFFDVSDQISIVFGTFLFGVTEQITGNMRDSAIALGLLTVIALVLLRRLRHEKIEG